MVAAAAALVVAVAWIPLRGGHSNVQVALALVVVMTVAGATGRRAAVLGATVAAGVAFTFFDTRPYDQLSIARQPDLATAVTLVVVGLLTGELGVRLTRTRRAESSATASLGQVRDAAALLAHGEELVVLIGAVAAEIGAASGATECWFSQEPLAAGTPVVGRDGTIERRPRTPSADAALPVWALGQVVGHFLLRAPAGGALDASRLVVAVTLADQVGAALAAHTTVLPPPSGPAGEGGGAGDGEPAAPRPQPRLRVVPAPGTPDPAADRASGPGAAESRPAETRASETRPAESHRPAPGHAVRSAG